MRDSPEKAPPSRPIYARFENPLERVKPGMIERPILGFLRLRGIRAMHTWTPWHHDLPYETVLNHEVHETRRDLKNHGRLLLLGASAGVSHAINVFSEVRADDPDADLWVIGVSGWVRIGDPVKLKAASDYRPHPAPMHRESVERCDRQAIPTLSKDSKRRMRLVIPAADEVVPTEYMHVDGVQEVPSPYEGHVPSIVRSSLGAPKIFDDMHAQYYAGQSL